VVVSPEARPRQIVAMGGGTFGGDGRLSPLDAYLLQLAATPRPRVCFLPTASAESPPYLLRFYEAFTADRCEPSHLLLFGRPRTDIRDFLLGQDVIYVGGGNTANMLAVWRVHGVDRVLAEAWERGVVLGGVSAGMICWFEAGVTDSFGPLAGLDDGLKLLPGSACPHYDGELDRRPAYQRLVTGGFPAGHAADDGAALHFVDRRLHEAIAGRHGARAWRVALEDGKVRETALPTRLLPNA
jgi:peptidase E